MAAINSTQYAKVLALKAGTTYAELKPSESHGRKRIMFFDYTTVTGSADGDILSCGIIPKGARILGGNLAWEALGTSVVGKLGIAGDDDKYLTAGTSMASIGSSAVAGTLALNFGVETTAEEVVILTLSGAAPTVSKIIRGFIQYVVD